MTHQTITRSQGRTHEQVRPISITYNSFGYADTTVLIELGNTKVLCSITLSQGVPPFLKGKGTGWLTAEYAMLPTATHVRTQREATTMKRNDRSIEISRLIGRALRTMVHLELLGERTIHVDCDVLQADGSTRVAAITGASLALLQAVPVWKDRGTVTKHIIAEPVFAISAGIRDGIVLVDLDFAEDSTIDADFNFVMTTSGAIIELQGTAEKEPVSWSDINRMQACVMQGSHAIKALFDSQPSMVSQPAKKAQATERNEPREKGSSLFSLQNRLTRVP